MSGRTQKMDPPPLIDFSDDAVVSSATSHSYTDPHGTRIFDRYLSSSSSTSSAAASSDDEDDADTTHSLSSASTIKRIDYMIDFLDRKLSTADDKARNRRTSGSSSSASSLPEFIGRGGDRPMFRPPVREAVHPERPPSLEVRRHPLRETQVGCFVRTIICTEKQLWGGGENGVRVWSLKELYSESSDPNGTAPFKESVKGVPPVLCLVGDEGSGVVWSGHRDGRVRCWRMVHGGGGRRLSDGFTEVLSWQAHRGPLLSLCISSYGIVWMKNVAFVVYMYMYVALSIGVWLLCYVSKKEFLEGIKRLQLHIVKL